MGRWCGYFSVFINSKARKGNKVYIYNVNIVFVTGYENQVTVFIFNYYWLGLMCRRIKKDDANLIHGRKEEYVSLQD